MENCSFKAGKLKGIVYFSTESFLYYGLTKCVGTHVAVPESEATEMSTSEVSVDLGLVSAPSAASLRLGL